MNRVLLSKHHRCTVEKNHDRCSLQVYMCLFIEIMGRMRMLNVNSVVINYKIVVSSLFLI